MNTKHFSDERRTRQSVIDKIGIGKDIAEFFWDRNHPDGPEKHYITNTGIIRIENAISGRLVTMLIARPGQICRYYLSRNLPIPAEMEAVIDLAREHQRLGFNSI